MAFKVLELIASFKADTTQVTKALKDVDGKAGSTQKVFKALGNYMKGAFAVAAVAGIAKVSKELVLAASDAEETGNKFAVVFSSISDEAEAAAENLADNFGLSSTAAKTLLSDTGDLLTGFGFTQDSALELSDQVNQLAVDLASFTNFSGGAKGASEALTKALLGERESVKALGISILDADVKAKVLENTQAGLTFETERQAKAYATLQLAQEQSKNAIGDFARSEDSFANQTRTTQAAIDDLKVAMGERLLPAATTAVSIFGNVARAFADAAEESNNYKKVIDGLESGELNTVTANIENLEQAIATLKDKMAESDITGLGFYDEDDIKELEALEDLLKRTKLAQQARTRATQEAALAEREAADAEKARLKAEQEAEDLRTEMAANRFQQMWDFAEEQKRLYDEEMSRRETEAEFNETNRERYATYLDNMTALDEEFNRRKLENEQAAEAAQELLYQQRYDAFMSMTNGIMALTALGAQSSAQAAGAYKVIAAAQAGINSYLAFTKTLTDGGPFPLNTINAAGILASGISQQVKIQTTSVPSFETGGVVPGTSYTGDNVRANVNSGEMILNAGQQAQLFNMANGGGLGNQTINIKIGSTDFATATVNALNTGKGGTINARVIK